MARDDDHDAQQRRGFRINKRWIEATFCKVGSHGAKVEFSVGSRSTKESVPMRNESGWQFVRGQLGSGAIFQNLGGFYDAEIRFLIIFVPTKQLSHDKRRFHCRRNNNF